VQEPEPVKLKPYSYLSEIQPETETVESEMTTRVGPKVKRTGIAEDAPMLGPQPTEAPPPAEGSDKGGKGATKAGKAGASASAPPVLFLVRKWDYEVFEKIFDLSVKGVLKQTDFIQVQTSFLGFV
jgi:hypothetical protein